MLVFLYRWRIKPRFERQFVESWSAITKYYRENAGSLGSRLHRGNDGIWYAYAQWRSSGQREAAFDKIPDHPAREKLKEPLMNFWVRLLSRLKPISSLLKRTIKDYQSSE